GSVIVTGSPASSCDCWAASGAIVTRRLVEVIASTGPACTVAPTDGVTLVTRTAPGSKTTQPSSSSLVCASPCAAWNALIAAAVAAVNAAPDTLPKPSERRLALSSATSRPGDMPDAKTRHDGTAPDSRLTGAPRRARPDPLRASAGRRRACAPPS